MLRAAADAPVREAVSAADLPELRGDLTVYLGRGEGGLYGRVLDAIRSRNPGLNLRVRRGPSTALANTLVAEAQAGVTRADVFWSIDAGSLGVVVDEGVTHPLPETLRTGIDPAFRYQDWLAISGRVRALAFNPTTIRAEDLPTDIMAFAESDWTLGWAPAYGSFQSFVTAMRVLAGEAKTRAWLEGVKQRARRYAGELGVVMATARGPVNVGFANHYYVLRLREGMPEASVDLAFTRGDAGSLVNASGAVLLNDRGVAVDFLRYLQSREVQAFLAREAYEIPLRPGVPVPEGLPVLADLEPPSVDLTRLADLRPTLRLMRETGVL